MFDKVDSDFLSVRTLPSKVDMVMLSEIVKDLQHKNVLTNKNVLDLRWFISSKFSQLTPQEAGKLFANSVNRIIDKNIPLLDEHTRSKVKTLLFEDAIKKSLFKISFYDVLKVCIQIKVDNYKFFEELANWVQIITGKQISDDFMSKFIKKVHIEMESNPVKSVNEIISIITEGRYEKSFSSSYAQKEETENNLYSPPNTITTNMPETEYSSSNTNSISSSFYQDNESISISSKNLELTHVSYDEYKPVYSFNKSSSNYFNKNDEDVKKKFSTFIKKVTMRKFLFL